MVALKKKIGMIKEQTYIKLVFPRYLFVFILSCDLFRVCNLLKNYVELGFSHPGGTVSLPLVPFHNKYTHVC